MTGTSRMGLLHQWAEEWSRAAGSFDFSLASYSAGTVEFNYSSGPCDRGRRIHLQRFPLFDQCSFDFWCRFAMTCNVNIYCFFMPSCCLVHLSRNYFLDHLDPHSSPNQPPFACLTETVSVSCCSEGRKHH